MPPNGNNLTITNPLVLYRSLIATNRIQPDPAQHRLALHLQKVYERLIQYEPTVEYSQRIQRITRGFGSPQNQSALGKSAIGTRGVWTSLLAQKERRDSLALTKVMTSHEAAMALDSPQGLMLHGEVGTGKSMLIDLFADCLPHQKKKRWHFNTFMLDTLSRLEALRKSRSALGSTNLPEEYSLLWLAKDLVEKSPILFLDEFQLPDRAASKILSNLMTSFFQLGGVLIATSNRMPEELAKAAGMEFSRPISRISRLGWSLGLGPYVIRDDGPGQKGEFAQFLEVLRARCEVWEMEGTSDYRRASGKDYKMTKNIPQGIPEDGTQMPVSESHDISSSTDETTDTALPKHYYIDTSPLTPDLYPLINASISPHTPISWAPKTLTIYGRPLLIPHQHPSGIAHFPFPTLCAAALGPADYTTLASTYHTLLLTSIPFLTFAQKNEARRLITLLDALYEARCRLLVTAAAGPDDILFPAAPPSPKGSHATETAADAVHPETFSEIHQDLTAPFRPNISSYAPDTLSPDALEDDPPLRARYTDERGAVRGEEGRRDAGIDFGHLSGLTGTDERFAVARARSRMWEMCSEAWWARPWSDASSDADGGAGTLGGRPAWWRPLPDEARHWERGAASSGGALGVAVEVGMGGGEVGRVGGREMGGEERESIFTHGASPFRTTSEAPPRISWTHVWGTLKWGRRAGAWGQGVEGLEERRREKAASKETDEPDSDAGRKK
ncbi:hypothetical protein EJ04DRAFT_597765 [Polyplosphaeria fusca]|uniref:AAA+ ATPase domain-containing protein n=1 Tax=Polyplosphaeria fusca TaxID=682080 RepID=A0A9P4R812_9PLEO|nr:hypothetical protein EJ04DRAFT_597765 [Polyplosphaeria fusca]